jgi:hypothetical protein
LQVAFFRVGAQGCGRPAPARRRVDREARHRAGALVAGQVVRPRPQPVRSRARQRRQGELGRVRR